MFKACRTLAIICLQAWLLAPPLFAQTSVYDALQDPRAEVQATGDAANEASLPATLKPTANELQAILERLNTIEKDAVKAAQAKKKTADEAAKAKKKEADEAAKKWNVKFGGHVQMDYVTWANTDGAIVDPDEGNYFSFRRLRLVADGTGYEQFDFRLQMTLEPGQGIGDPRFSSPDVKDAYLSMNDVPGIGRIRAGNFFVPFGLEQVTNDSMNIFLERSIPTQGIFTADRELGIAVYNCNSEQTITWTGGMFFDDISDSFKTRIDDNQGFRLSGRLTGLPYYDAASNGRYLIHTGIGVLYTNDYDDKVRFRARPQVQRGPVLIDSGTFDADDYTVGNVELAAVMGRLTLQSEAYLCSVNRGNLGNDTIGGAYVHASFFMTGENRVFEPFGQHGAQFGRNKPSRNFALTKDKFELGAVEAKLRWSLLDLSGLQSGQYNDLTAGFNWYLSDRTRVMFDWIHPYTSGETKFGSTESDLIAMRLDFNW